jgi:CRP/FNR family transcriptional regulator
MEPKGNNRCSLNASDVFAGAGKPVLATLEKLATDNLVYAPAQTIYEAGSPARDVYILNEGYIKLFKTSATGKNQIIRVVKPGEVFGFDGLVDALYNHSAVSLRQVLVCRISVADLQSLGEHKAEVERLLMVRCIRELQHADERLLELGAKRSAERLASFLLEWCDDTPADRWKPLILSRLEIAQLLGLTIETVSRLFALWKREGIIGEQRQAIQLSDARKLRMIASSN